MQRSPAALRRPLRTARANRLRFQQSRRQLCAAGQPPASGSDATVTEAGVTVTAGGDSTVFYNPAMQLNRDASMLAAAAFAERRVSQEGAPPMRVLDALSASGLRALRYAATLPAAHLGSVVANGQLRQPRPHPSGGGGGGGGPSCGLTPPAGLTPSARRPCVQTLTRWRRRRSWRTRSATA